MAVHGHGMAVYMMPMRMESSRGVVRMRASFIINREFERPDETR